MQMPWEISERDVAEQRESIIGIRARDLSSGIGTGRLRRYIGESCPYCRNAMTRDGPGGWNGPRAPSRDHRVPISRGGLNVRVNIIVCCRKCNEHKGSLDEEEYLAWKSGKVCRLDHPPRGTMRSSRVRYLPLCRRPLVPYIILARIRAQFCPIMQASLAMEQNRE